jgi:cytochrome b561
MPSDKSAIPRGANIPAVKDYDAVAKLLHWLIVALLIAQYTVGSLMPHIGRNTKDEGLVAWHFSIGSAILLFIVIRFLWRLSHPVPLIPTDPLSDFLAKLVHWGLYLLVFVMTMLGWAATSARGWDVKLFGVLTLPALAPNGSRWGHEAGDIHNVLVYVLLGFIVVHIGAALYHRFFLRDQIFQRMMP